MSSLGPQLIGQVEKAFAEILRAALITESLDETHWVALRLSAQFYPARHGDFADFLRSQAQIDHAQEVIVELERRGLVGAGRPLSQGVAVLTRVGGRIDSIIGPVFRSLDPADAASTERTLTRVLEGAREAIATLRTAPAADARP